MSLGFLIVALILAYGGAEGKGIDHANPCKSRACASYPTLPLLLQINCC